MDNPAEYMLQFFKCEERENGFDDGISEAFKQMHDTQACLDNLLAMNVKRLDSTEKVMPGIWEKLWATYANVQPGGGLVSFSMKPRRDIELNMAQQQALEKIADKIPENPLALSDDNNDSLRQFLDDVITAAQDDDTLPKDLRMFIIRLAHEALRNLDEYEAGNDFELKDAIQKLFGLLYVAETQTSKPGIWEKLKTTIAKPFAGALITAAANEIVNGGAQAVLQITAS